MESMSFEEAIKRLEVIAVKLEREDVALEEAVKLYEEGMKLVELCSKKLEEAQKKVRLITAIRDGKMETEAFDGEAE